MVKYFPAKLAIACFSVTLLCSCTDPSTGQVTATRARTVVESSAGGDAKIQVYLEGADGNMLTGAAITVTDYQNRYEMLPFVQDDYCYVGTFPVPSDGVLDFFIDSNGIDESLSYSVPHRTLSEAPTITVFQDSSGDSVLSGESLDSALTIQIGWEKPDVNAVCIVNVRDQFGSVFSLSTKATSCLIPAGTLTAGKSYGLIVSAQLLYGDPTFKSYAYYSVSSVTGPRLGFTIE